MPRSWRGAYSTDLWIDTARRLVFVYLVQHNGYLGDAGANILPTFRKQAVTAHPR